MSYLRQQAYKWIPVDNVAGYMVQIKLARRWQLVARQHFLLEMHLRSITTDIIVDQHMLDFTLADLLACEHKWSELIAELNEFRDSLH